MELELDFLLQRPAPQPPFHVFLTQSQNPGTRCLLRLSFIETIVCKQPWLERCWVYLHIGEIGRHGS